MIIGSRPMKQMNLFGEMVERTPWGKERPDNSVRSTNDANQPLPYPAWTDERFFEEQTVFGGHEDGLTYEYEDRLCEWDGEKAREAKGVANMKAGPRTARWYSAFLSAYHGRAVVVKHVTVHINRSNGYPVYCLGYGDKQVKK